MLLFECLGSQCLGYKNQCECEILIEIQLKLDLDGVGTNLGTENAFNLNLFAF